jgi:Uma2 family endonuclease
LGVAFAVESSEIYRVSTDKYHEFIECGALVGARVELIHGLICDMSPRTEAHELVCEWLNRFLATRLNEKLRLRVASSLTTADSEPEPDFAVIAPGAVAPYHPGSAELVIEVCISSRHRDLVVKPPIYASAGVKEYWVIDVERSRVIVHQHPAEDRYELQLEFGPEHSIDASVVGIEPIAVAEILGAARRSG